MRLLFICNEYPPFPHGGIGTFVVTLARQLVVQGHTIHVIGLDHQVPETRLVEENGVIVTRLASPFYRRWYLTWGRYEFASEVLERIYLSWQVRAYCQHHRIDLVESYDWGGPLWFHPGRPLVVRMHGAHSAHAHYEGIPSSLFLRYMEKKNLCMGDTLVGVSQHISDLTLKALGLQDRNFKVIYNGVDTTLFRPLEDIPRSEHEVLFAGTVARRKGIYEMFAAIPLVLDAVPTARFTILGRLPADEDKRQKLMEELLSSLPPEQREHITFTGAQPHDEMSHWYNRATCTVFPSLAEAYGLTCVEAMACGTPVVMTSRASGPEIVEHGKSGLLCEPTDHQELADAIVTLLQNPSLCDSISSNAIARVRQKFDQQALLETNLSLYRGLTS